MTALGFAVWALPAAVAAALVLCCLAVFWAWAWALHTASMSRLAVADAERARLLANAELAKARQSRERYDGWWKALGQ